MQQELEVGLIATIATTGEVQTASADIPIATTCTSDVIDVTDRVGDIVADAGIVGKRVETLADSSSELRMSR